MATLNGQSLLSGALSGLTSTYSLLLSSSSKSGKGLTLDDLTNVSNDTINKLGSNYNFLQYLTNNFNSFDRDGDGEINGKDIDNMMNTMQTQGLTYNEIQQLCSSGGGNATLLNTVLTYFNKIDKNGDGRVTSAEISSFGFESDRQRLDSKYNGYKASNASLYYSEGVEDDTTSIIDELYPDLNGSNS